LVDVLMCISVLCVTADRRNEWVKSGLKPNISALLIAFAFGWLCVTFHYI